MANSAAGLLAYAGILAVGNPLTNLISIGSHSAITGKIPGHPHVPQGGFSTPSFVEGQLSDCCALPSELDHTF